MYFAIWQTLPLGGGESLKEPVDIEECYKKQAERVEHGKQEEEFTIFLPNYYQIAVVVRSIILKGGF